MKQNLNPLFRIPVNFDVWIQVCSKDSFQEKLFEKERLVTLERKNLATKIKELLSREVKSVDSKLARQALIDGAKHLTSASSSVLANISHTQGQLGLAVVFDPSSNCSASGVGIDVEYADRRISPAATRRILKSVSPKLKLDALQAWNILEAAYKSLKRPQKSTLLSLTIQDYDADTQTGTVTMDKALFKINFYCATLNHSSRKALVTWAYST